MKKESNNNKKRLSDIYNAKSNSFTLMSVILSLLIIYFHCYVLFYGPMSPQADIFSHIFRGENTGSIVVATFCVISGFMITSSIQRSKNIKEYLKKRVKKIFPAYILVLIISALVIAPIVSSISLKSYYLNPSLYTNYVIDNLLLFKNSVYSIGDVFINNPYPSAINGTIWYIKHQFSCYLYMIPLFIIFLKSKDNRKYEYKYFFIIILILIIMSYSGSFVSVFRIIKQKLGYIGVFNEIESLVRIIYYFSAGVFINIYKDKIMYDKKNVLFALLILILTFRTKLFTYFCLILLPYFIIYLGSLKSKIKVVDISYYIFLVGFPVQQVLIHYLTNEINFIIYIGLSLNISILCGYLIHIVIDKLPKLIKKEREV